MKLSVLQEPELQFAQGSHICPRAGIARFSVYDSILQTRRERIHVGAVGTSECLDKLGAWLNFCAREIPGKKDAKQPNLFSDFPGFNRSSGFKADFLFNSEITRQISKAELKEVTSVTYWDKRVADAVELYFKEVKFLAQNRTVDVIVCILPDTLYKKVTDSEKDEGADAQEAIEADSDIEQLTGDTEGVEESDEDITELENNFRRQLKARVMSLGRPIQIMRERSLESKADQQDEATKAWNFCTALYYKSGQTIPWRMLTDTSKPSVCAIGISFYRSRDGSTLNTSLAQMFDELGNGLILRGTPIQSDKQDRRPYMTSEQSAELLDRALSEYRDALKTMPARVIIHKTSNFRDCELDGLRSAAKKQNVGALDFVTVMNSDFRLFRNGTYPTYRGVRVEMDESTHILYTRGSVPYYSTYTGIYIPNPLEIRIVDSEESPATICQEILALTKMNWNNTQFDGKYPVTIGCSRKVGEILKYLPDNQTPQIRYSYYM
jgi:argonaute-like protein implicated in RNA metabolism and viral defense